MSAEKSSSKHTGQEREREGRNTNDKCQSWSIKANGPGRRARVIPHTCRDKGEHAEEAAFKGGGDEETACVWEYNKGKHGGEDGERRWHKTPSSPGS